MDKNKIMVVVAVVLIGVLLWWQPWGGSDPVDPCAAHDATACGEDTACTWGEVTPAVADDPATTDVNEEAAAVEGCFTTPTE